MAELAIHYHVSSGSLLVSCYYLMVDDHSSCVCTDKIYIVARLDVKISSEGKQVDFSLAGKLDRVKYQSTA